MSLILSKTSANNIDLQLKVDSQDSYNRIRFTPSVHARTRCRPHKSRCAEKFGFLW